VVLREDTFCGMSSLKIIWRGIAILLLFFWCSHLSADNLNLIGPGKSKTNNSSLKKARKFERRGNYEQAELYYRRYILINPGSFTANKEIGTMLLMNSYKQPESVPFLEAAYELLSNDTLKNSDLLYHLAKAYHFIGRFEEAITIYRDFQKYLRKNTNGYFLNAEVLKEIDDCVAGLEFERDQVYRRVKVENLGGNINTQFSEYVPIIIGKDATLLFTSRRKGSTGGRIDPKDEKFFEDMYISKRKGSEFMVATKFGQDEGYVSNLSNTESHESLVNLSYDGAHLITFRENSLWISELINEKWKEARRMHKNINLGKHQTHASLTEDGNTIYFTSNANHGFGEMDIYKSVRVNKQWMPAVNLGPVINTKYAEDSPQISDDGTTLYFSSKGHNSMGGFDIFRTELVDGRWSDPINLGTPVNSAADDIFFRRSRDGEVGYFASAREGGFGDMDIYKAVFGSYAVFNNCGTVVSGEFEVVLKVRDYVKRVNSQRVYQWDLGDGTYAEGLEVTYKYKRPGTFNVKLNTYNIKNNRTKYVKDDIPVRIHNVNHMEFLNSDTVMVNTEVLFDGSVTMFKYSEITDYYWKIDNDIELGGVTLRHIFREPGTYSISYEVDSRDTLKYEYSKHCVTKNIAVLSEDDYRKFLIRNGRQSLEAQLFLGNRYNSFSKGGVFYSRLRLEPIYYDYNRSNIRKDAKRTMDRNIAVLAKVPDAIIKVVSHSDARGSDEYNYKLAERRARAAIRYLVRKGVPRERVAASISRGETDLVNNCYDNTPCSRRQHQMNRRSDFVVIGFIQDF